MPLFDSESPFRGKRPTDPSPFGKQKKVRGATFREPQPIADVPFAPEGEFTLFTITAEELVTIKGVIFAPVRMDDEGTLTLKPVGLTPEKRAEVDEMAAKWGKMPT